MLFANRKVQVARLGVNNFIALPQIIKYCLFLFDFHQK